jgi:hypothetical protein
METTVAHIVLERLNAGNENIVIPKEFEGNLIAEHHWLMFSESGPKLMLNHKDLFQNVCQEVDYAINEGVASFSDEGVITIQQNIL